MTRLLMALMALNHTLAFAQVPAPPKRPSKAILATSELDLAPTPPKRPGKVILASNELDIAPTPPKRPGKVIAANELDIAPSTPPPTQVKKPNIPNVIFVGPKKSATPSTPPATASKATPTPPPAPGKPTNILPDPAKIEAAEKAKPKFPMCSEKKYTDNPKDVAAMFGEVLGFQHALNQEVVENGGNHTRVLLASQGGKLQFKIDLDYQGFPVSLYAPGKVCQKDDGSLIAVVATSEAKKRDWMLASSGEVADTYRVTISRVNAHAVRLSEPTGKLNNVFSTH